jgi:hypothetical protein
MEVSWPRVVAPRVAVTKQSSEIQIAPATTWNSQREVAELANELAGTGHRTHS